MAVTGRQQVQHFSGCRAKADKLLFREFPGVDDTDRSGKPLVFVNHAVPHDCDTDFVGKMPHHDGLGTVKNHAGLVEHTADHINGVLGRIEMLFARQNVAVGIGDFDVFPLVDVDFLHIIPVEIFGQERKAGHLAVN